MPKRIANRMFEKMSEYLPDRISEYMSNINIYICIMSVAMSEPCQTECKYPMSSKTLSQCLEYRVLDRTSEVWSDRVPKKHHKD